MKLGDGIMKLNDLLYSDISRFLYNGMVRLFSVRKDFFRLVKRKGNFRRIKYE